MNSEAPIILEPYSVSWPTKFELERRSLAILLKPWLVGPIEHVGSTAVPELSAKPIIDIMAAISDLPSSMTAIEALGSFSYCYAPYKVQLMHWFCKPSPRERAYHLHLVPFKSVLWKERIAFRDVLRASENVRSRYIEVKETLALKYRDDRDAYTEGKSDFINSVLAGTLP